MNAFYKFVLSFSLIFSSTLFANDLALKIDGVYLPHQGFDDNDEIELVLDTHLPNICYRAKNPIIKIDEINKKILLKVSAVKRELAECQSENLASPYQFPIQYAENLKLGKLSAGDYTVIYGENSNEQTSFVVEKASISSIDEKLYAPIGQIFVPEMISHNDEVQVIITGVLNNSCMGLQEKNIKVLHQGDTFVVLPVLTYSQSKDCQSITRPFQFIMSLGKQKIGRYLIHARSLSGQSLNRLFTIKDYTQADSEVSF